MQFRLMACTLLGLVLTTIPAFGQNYPSNPLRGTERPPAARDYPPPQPDQPIRPQTPQFERRPQQSIQPPAPPQPPPPPFVLSPQQEAQVDRVLNQWEQRNREVRKFDCKFKRWTYDAVFGRPDQARFVEMGTIRYAAPDKGLFYLEAMERDGKKVPIEDSRAEHWICDGKAVFEYSPVKKKVTEHRLPKELQGKAIANSPLPFLFGAEAQKLKQRYFLRLVTPAEVRDQIWLEAYPRTQTDAANFIHAQFIISVQGMSPFALKIFQTDKIQVVYQFWDIQINDPLGIFRGDPFRAFTPPGWQRDIDEPPAESPPPPSPQVRRPIMSGRR
jgi:TIGR03009 family protein